MKEGGIRDVIVYFKIIEIKESLNMVNENLADHIGEFFFFGNRERWGVQTP